MEIINATGRRKTSVARVYLKPGKGEIVVNNRPLNHYFQSEIHQSLIQYPFQVAKAEGQFDVQVNVEGGGVKGQAEAVRLGIARALVQVNEEQSYAAQRRVAYPRQPHGGTQKIRPQKGTQKIPVQ